MFDLARTEPAVGRALAKIGHLLMTPFDILKDTEVVEKVCTYLSTHSDLVPEPGEGPTQAEFEAFVA